MSKCPQNISHYYHFLLLLLLATWCLCHPVLLDPIPRSWLLFLGHVSALTFIPLELRPCPALMLLLSAPLNSTQILELWALGPASGLP